MENGNDARIKGVNMSEKMVKTRWHNPNSGRTEIIEMKAKDIVANPSRHEFESIVASICYCLTELVNKEADREERLKNILSNRNTAVETAVQINEGVN